MTTDAKHESIISRLNTTYRKPCGVEFVNELESDMLAYAREHGINETTIKQDFLSEMFRRNRGVNR